MARSQITRHFACSGRTGAGLIALVLLVLTQPPAFADFLGDQEPSVSAGYWQGYDLGKGAKRLCLDVTSARLQDPSAEESPIYVLLDFHHQGSSFVSEPEIFHDGSADLMLYRTAIDEKSLWTTKHFGIIVSEQIGLIIAHFEELVEFLATAERAEILQRPLKASVSLEGFKEVRD